MAVRANLTGKVFLPLFSFPLPAGCRASPLVGSKAYLVEKSLRAGRKLFPATSAIVGRHIPPHQAGIVSCKWVT